MLRNWQRYGHVRIECNGDFVTVRALQSRLELALHEVNNYRLVSLQVSIPMLSCKDSIFLPIGFLHFHIRFLRDSVQVFMQVIKQEV